VREFCDTLKANCAVDAALILDKIEKRDKRAAANQVKTHRF
jgi:hypothetical protein